MKTAEEWARSPWSTGGPIAVEVIRAIQADARRAALEEAIREVDELSVLGYVRADGYTERIIGHLLRRIRALMEGE